ncbi:FliM/FliN family flagellar motor switch protein [Sphingorhabdus sp. M41]|uniref:FliM/FliN family flagellar motor switch protein n=1 Tax=Sphingorhabdus sp. M41 TaxID=1806885 RepID=UPI00078BD776|nr:FliM/FliN family flagellar motor switch protein [Sphingorhabdus sp. M41]AMO72621.1 flagellar motor switch protein FliN [Sphingorhabdus sp. M41]
MSVLGDIYLDVSIVLGTTKVPIHQILKMSRGAIISLDASRDDPSEVLVNGRAIARGEVQVQNEGISLEITEIMEREVE